MKISNLFPPNYEEIKKKFNPPESVVFTYGDTIYTPYVYIPLAKDLIVHEEVHSKQQKGEPGIWWRRYIEDPDFRLNQELVAYRKQYQYYIAHNPRDKAFLFIHHIAKDLSSTFYDNIIDYDTALRLIRQ